MRDYVVKANASEDPKTRLDDDEIIAEMFTLTLAGHETTSSTLTFLFYELARHPKYQARMREEIRNLRARVTARGGSEFTIEDLDSLTLTMNAIKVSRIFPPTGATSGATYHDISHRERRRPQETLRMHPILVGLPRVAEKDDVVPLSRPITSISGEVITEIPIRRGQLIHLSFAGYQRYAP